MKIDRYKVIYHDITRYKTPQYDLKHNNAMHYIIQCGKP